MWIAPHGPIDSARLDAFEAELGSRLPVEFREWLELINGGKPENTCVVVPDNYGVACFHHVYGLHQGGDYAQLDRVNGILAGSLNPGLVAFGDDPGGNQFTISIRPEQHGAVIFWDHETGDEYALGASFPDFVASLQSEYVLIPRDDLEMILRKDDVVSLDRWLEGKNIDEKDEDHSSPLEWAAVYASLRCIEYLHERGAKPFDALIFAKRNLKFFPAHKATVELLEKLYPAGE